ncbi:MAG TPA: GNAT family N-acetyltransferase [Pyrinomonadaceae bacterium]|nr:GNAT family N-acetyltransferase [Pyrinomonadaceae bacterium]
MTEWHRNGYTISTDRAELDVPLIHDFLSNSTYWATGRKIEVVQRSLDNSLCFGLFKIDDGNKQQVGFARVVTDYATFGWVADVFILPSERGQGLGKWLTDVIISHPDLQGFRRWVLATKDAHELYRRVGFRELHRPERWMERPDPKMQESPDYWNKKE